MLPHYWNLRFQLREGLTEGLPARAVHEQDVALLIVYGHILNAETGNRPPPNRVTNRHQAELWPVR